MLSIKKLVVIVLLPLMFGAIILTGLEQLRTNELDLWHENARQDINKEARNIVIGQAPGGEGTVDRDIAREQFRGVVIYSQISAVNCRLLYWIHAQGQEGNKLSNYKSGSGIPGKIGQNSPTKIEYVIPGRPNGEEYSLFNYLERSNYVPTCVGTGNAISHHLVDKRIKHLRKGNLLRAGYEFAINTFVGGLEDLWNIATCKLEPSWLSNRGNDMEGRYGRITFDSEVTIFPGKYDGRVWGPQFLNYVGNCPADNEEYVGPHFFEGGEYMDWLPWPDSGTPEGRNYGVNGNDPAFVEHSSAESDAIIDAPALSTANLDNIVPADDYPAGSAEGNDAGEGDFPRKEVFYAVCENSTGYVQTNANTIWNNGEAVWGKNNKVVGEYRGFETRTFTKVKVQGNKTACLKNQHEGGPDILEHGNLYGTSHSCNNLQDANEEKVVDYYTGEYECVTRKYDWKSDGRTVAHIWEIGWISVD